jgi:hypothetical protein
MTPEATLGFGQIVADGAEDFILETVDALMAITESTHKVFNAMSPNWVFPKVFDDEHTILGATKSNPWFADYPISQYHQTVFVHAPPGTVIEGGVIGRNTFIILSCTLIAAILALKTGLKAAALMGTVYNYFFGVKALVKSNAEAIDGLYDVINDAMDLEPEKQGTVSASEDKILQNQEVLKYILRNADEDISGVIKALVHDNRQYLVDLEWDLDAPELVTTPSDD